MICLEKDIPLPKARDRGVGSEVCTALQAMEINQSFVFWQSQRKTVQNAITRYKGEKTYTVRKLNDGTCRVWRVK